MSPTQRRIPVVNLSHYRTGTPQERARFVQVFGDGIKEFGFVTVEGHGIDDGLIRRTYTDVERFFALPEATKAQYAQAGHGGQRGYIGYGQEHAKNRQVGDLKEFWHVGRELPPDHKYHALYGPNVWPTEVSTFREHTLSLFNALDGAAGVMLQALAEYFGVARDTFSGMATDGNSVLRLIHYPPLKERFIPGGVRAAEHEDINLITLLCEGTASGLELLTRDGEWLPVDTLRGQIVVDSGDMLSRVTNEIIPATTHRVVNPRSKEEDTVRYSMPFFVHPYADCVLQALPCTQTADTPARHAPITADAFLKQRLRENGLLK
ncbi:oxidoreductase, 2OG-Fe(II) oxygenase family [Myxococcus xanthus DK 1622]|uniref:2-oxoglutarate-dependent ethylene/succinate-forming enzyme n=1 Tax=Myxococcus xanthus (strain DK1622) TaxID=246197 RepID=Q1DCA0_MYXXD|nr:MULTISPECIES: 2-oxoglutarate and iron-dependent oxygenase domain-containing protein [Myxococcus]ABF91825.1 oxidoreductase, 2OG-Fe(II) oxygenase family [Myxococcus xanthus DK 1622]NOJ57677.1 isopenicillin N synthase family oxygenase [Myxococcus xanthus]QPM81104.1 isopenicillin N synthase family oxygenase [Myxococcus xanthus]QVW70163.1 isopenicillin N synthase family oxygenase [Myxococcus xanthus DZ2]QZZ48997.1 Validamycin A dioxygenase [Myxococcus xanthus]